MKALAVSALLLAVLTPAIGAACTLPSGAAALLAEAGSAMNAQRAGAGRKALDRDARLDQAAQAHACWMADNATFSHKGAGGSLPKQRIKATGYVTRLSAENIAHGQATGSAVIASWMASSGHRENILRRGIDDYGVGVALLQGRPAWVMVFAAD